MAIARAQLVDVALTRWYHCVTRVFAERSCWEKETTTARSGWKTARGTRGNLCGGRRWFLGMIIDLNPVAAEVAKTPETSDYTSIKQRVDHSRLKAGPRNWKQPMTAASPVRKCGRSGRVAVALSDRGPPPTGFVPRRYDLGLFAGKLSPSGRLHRPPFSRGKSIDLGGIGRVFERLGCTAENWQIIAGVRPSRGSRGGQTSRGSRGAG